MAQAAPATAPPGARSGAHRQEAKQRLAAPEAPAAPSQKHTSVPRPGPLSTSSGPASSPHPAAHTTSPASGQRPTTRGRRQRASSSWTGGGGGGRDDSQGQESQGHGGFQSPSGARNGHHALTATGSDGTGNVILHAGPRTNQDGFQGVPLPLGRPAVAHWVSLPEWGGNEGPPVAQWRVGTKPRNRGLLGGRGGTNLPDPA